MREGGDRDGRSWQLRPEAIEPKDELGQTHLLQYRRLFFGRDEVGDVVKDGREASNAERL
jgi:hypothetical protein